MKKRWLSFLMAAVMCLTLLPISAQAYEIVPVIAVDMTMPKPMDKPEDMKFEIDPIHKDEYEFYDVAGIPKWRENRQDGSFRNPCFYAGERYMVFMSIAMKGGHQLPGLPADRYATDEEIEAFAQQIQFDLGYGPIPTENRVRTQEELGNGKYIVSPITRDYTGHWVIQLQYCLELPPQEGIKFDEENFPDIMFREKLEEVLPPEIIQDHYLTEAELASFTTLNISNSGIKDLTGLEFFKNLEELDFSRGRVERADLRGLPKLTKVLCSENDEMEELNVTGNPKLTVLDCSYSQLTHLDLSHNPELVELNCDSSYLEELDLSRNLKLKDLNVTSNQLMALDLSKNRELEHFAAYTQNRRVLEGDFLSNYGLWDMSKVEMNNSGAAAAIENGRIHFIQDYVHYDYECGVADDGYRWMLYCSMTAQRQQEPYDLPGYLIWNENFESPKLPAGWKAENRSKYHQIIMPKYSRNTHHGYYAMSSSNAGEPNNLIYTPEIQVGKGYHLTFSFSIDDDGSYIKPEQTEPLKTYVQAEGRQPVQIGKTNRAWTNWQTDTLDLSAYEGQKIRVIFEHKNDYTQVVDLRLDCVALWSDAMKLDEKSFPDRNLLNVIKRYDKNGDGLLDRGEDSAITELDLTNASITDFTGISHLKYLQKLVVDGTGAAELDLTANHSLKSLSAANCPKLKKLNVSGCADLEKLNCKNSGVEVLEVFDCTGLKSLDCSDSHIAKLELDTCGQLEKLYCNNAPLAALNLDHQSKLTVFEGTGWEREVEQDSLRSQLWYLDMSRVSEVKGGTLEDGIICFAPGSPVITYTYRCDDGHTARGRLVRDPSTMPSFRDVKPSDWFYGGVMYATERGLFKGISPVEFGPTIPMTRSMVVQVLYSMAGKPAVEKSNRFVDVKDYDWFADAVAWGVENGVTAGYPGGRFAPDDKVNREQLAVMLHGYRKKPAASEPLTFADKDTISGWAKDAVQWAVENHLMGGVPGNKILPQGLAERSQGAVIMMNFDKLPK